MRDTNQLPTFADLVSVTDLCTQFGVSRDWIYKRVADKAEDRLPFLRLGRLIRFRSEEVRAYLDLRQIAKTVGSLLATNGIARANGRRKGSMARKRFQKGHVRLRNTGDPCWEGFYWEDLRLTDNQVVRKQRAINLGHSTEVPSKKLAERKLAEKLAEVNDIDYRPRPVTTVKDFVDMRYKKLILPLRKRTTRHGYEVVLAHHILPEFGAKQLVDVTGEDVQAFVTRKSGGGLAWNTVKNIISVFSAVYAAAVKFGYLKVNPVRSVEMSQEPVKYQAKLPSDKELQQLQNELDEPYRTMVWLACATGVRVSELLALRWRSIDWVHSCLWVREAVHNGEIDSPKTHRSQRPIRLNKSDLVRLKKFRKARPRSKDEDWLFLNTRGTAPFLADNVLERIIRPAVKKLGITHVTWHLLRHWHPNVLHDEGVSIKVTQERLGHSRAETTMKHYVHLSQQDDAEAANAVSRRLRRSAKTGNSRSFVSRIVSRTRVAGAEQT
jgi:excisionase family DNA binding protein